MSRWEDLFEWRELVLRGLGVDRRLTVEDLTCEGLSRKDLPDWVDEEITQFRHLRTDKRESAIRTYYNTRKVVALRGCSRVHVPPGTMVTHAWCDPCEQWTTFAGPDDRCDACDSVLKHKPMTVEAQEKIRAFARFIYKGMDGDCGLEEEQWLAIAENFINGEGFQENL